VVDGVLRKSLECHWEASLYPLILNNIGAIEEVILQHPDIGEASVVGLPDPLKGHVPLAFVQLRSNNNSSSAASLPATPTPELFAAVNKLVREQIGAIASLGGMIQGRGMIPKTRSGKTVRRVLRDLVENAVVKGDYSSPVNVPPTVEDMDVVEIARAQVKNYFEEQKLKTRRQGQASN
jgi:propionyl-CoA synthetase